MAKKRLVKRETIEIPKSIEEATEFIGIIGKHQRELNKIQMRINNQIEKIKSEALAESLVHQEIIDKLFEGIFIFAQSHREELTEGGRKKTIHLPTGDILWRMTPPAVSLKNVKKVIELCKSSGLERFIRVKENINKEAMLKEPEVAKKISGVTISQKEEFVVKPSEIEIEISRDTKRLQKSLR